MSLPTLERAKTGRSTCRGCGEGISAGDLRVGVEAFVAGRVAMTWQHPACALRACHLERCPANRGKCKATDESFAKGDARLCIRSKEHKSYYGLAGMGPALRPALEAVPGFDVADVAGFADLDASLRAAVADALRGEDANPRAGKRAKRRIVEDDPAPAQQRVSVAEVKVESTPRASAKRAPAEKDDASAAEEKSTPAARTTRAARRASAGVPTPEAEEAKTRPAKPELKPAAVEEELTAFEREREERIARNKARMAALNIGGLAADVAPAKAAASGPIQRGIGAKRQRAPKPPPGPPRRSSRVRKEALDPALAGGVDYERRDGTVALVHAGASIWAPAVEEDRGLTRPVGDVALESNNGTESADEAFIAFLKRTLAAPRAEAAKVPAGKILLAADHNAACARGAGANVAPPTSAAALARANLGLTDETVAKVVPRGVTHLDVAPYHPDGPVLVAAGDKDGNVGLWRVDADEDAAATAERTDDEEGDGSEDGVLFFKPHGSYVCHLKWGRGGLGGKLVSCAYDGVVRALDAEKAAFLELFASEDDDEFSACDVSADGREMHLVDNHGNYHRVDVRAGKLAAPAVQLHEKKINTVHLEPGAERAIATSCGDQTVCVWDVRRTGKGAKPLSRLQHGKSCQAAYWSPDGAGHLLTTCYDDLLRVWRPAGGKGATAGAVDEDPKSALKIRHNNQTGRWVLPFRAVWTPGSDGVVVGSMRREVEIFDAKTGALAAKLSDADRMTAIASRFAVHPSRNLIAAGTASGRVHIYR